MKPTPRRLLAAALAPFLLACPAPAQTAPELTLERIMSDPDWMGNSPESPWWADDSQSFYYRQKRVGSNIRDVHHVTLDGQVRLVPDEELADIDAPGGVRNLDRTMRIYERSGDIYVKDLRTDAVRQLTRAAARVSNPMFLTTGEVAYRRAGDWFIRDLDTGLERQAADLRFEKDPAEKTEEGYLPEQQQRYFDVLRERKRRADESRDHARAQQAADPARAPLPWWLGDKHELASADLAPSGDHMLLRLNPKGVRPGKRDNMPQWVTDSGYVENRAVRELVGTSDRTAQSLVLLNLATRERHDVDLTKLPMIDDDPLAEIKARTKARREAEKKAKDKKPEPEEQETPVAPPADADTPAQEPKPAPSADKPKHRTVSILNVTWSDDGSRVAFQARSNDNKDRWTCVLDAATQELTVVEHLRDEAWINWRFSDIGWMPDNARLWFLSEDGGYAHLHLADAATGETRRLTEGPFEVSGVRLSDDASRFFVSANREHPGIDQLYSVDADTGAMTRITALGGRNRAIVSPDESRLLVVHSTPTTQPELYLQDAAPNSPTRRMTHTASDAFTAIAWAEPEVVAIASSHSDHPIYARVYTPAPDAPGAGDDGRRPAVMFVHGAGYLQNAHHGWSTYYREFMFHTLLTRLGYVVIDADYRASAGYGRDWRTAIYRRMGEPELEDFRDAVGWLAEHKDVDPARVGVYGGSYGGFMTLMALFREPDLFACGAALRPVTDWAHYNHGYTANILNTPGDDPESYERSSPIEFADGLSKPLLICHGMVDDNVFFKDTVRLAQRLIELKKQDWEVAVYPVEPHGFTEPTSWLDEYRRILKLFETHLK